MQSRIEASLLPPDNSIYSVTQITNHIKKILETELPEFWLRGEISNFRRQGSGHCYFSLKDSGSQITAVLFRGDAVNLNMDIRDGISVIIFGQLTVYPPRGNYQIIVRYLVEDGAGRLQLEFERVKQKLAEAGLFDKDKKKTLPILPGTIGLVTSPTGAAIRDFISILQRSGWRGNIIVFPVRVQGVESVIEIKQALELAQLFDQIELLVLTRGGGSIEDLWSFNDEMIVRSIADSKIPVISAVGHEIDFTLCDFVADYRAETPSAAAAVIADGYFDAVDRLINIADQINQTVIQRFEKIKYQIDLFESTIDKLSPQSRVEQSLLRLDDLSNRLDSAFQICISREREKVQYINSRLAGISIVDRIKLLSRNLDVLKDKMGNNLKLNAQTTNDRFNNVKLRLLQISPEKVLKRGYVIVKDDSNCIVSSRAALKQHDILSNQFYDGLINVKVLD